MSDRTRGEGMSRPACCQQKISVAVKKFYAYILAMTPLKRYLIENGIKQSWMAVQVGVTSSAMSLYVNGLRVPSPVIQGRIERFTQRQVKAGRDWPNGKERQ